MNEVIKYYRVYLDRNNTFDEFARDVNTLGGTFENGWIDTTKEEVTIKNKSRQTICTIKLKEVWRLGKVNQMSLL